MKKECGIYKISCHANSKFYIGSSVNMIQRMRVHKSDLRANRHPNQHLQSAWNKYEEKDFSFDIIEFCEVVDLEKKEQYYLDSLDACNREIGFNIARESGKINRQGKDWIIITPEGEEILVNNLTDYCRNNDLVYGCMTEIAYSRGRCHRGFQCRLPEILVEDWKQQIEENCPGKADFNIDWEITHPDGSKEITSNLVDFCNHNSLTVSAMRHIAGGRGKTHKGFKCKRIGENKKYTYKITDPDGNIFMINNLSQFCRENNLLMDGLFRVMNGHTEKHKGYKCEKIECNREYRKIKKKEKTLRYTWIVIYPDGHEEKIYDLKIFCAEHNLSYDTCRQRRPCNGYIFSKIDCNRYYIITDPSGKTFEVDELKEFCLNNNLNPSMMHVVANNGKQYRGYSCKRIVE